MNSDQLQGKWKQIRGGVKEQWGNLTGDDLDQIEGKRDKLVGKVQERYGKTKEQAQQEVDEYLARY